MSDVQGPDPRTTLGVSPDAPEEEVRRAYKRMKAVYASDATYGLLAPEELQKIRELLEAAYAALMDPERRRARPEPVPAMVSPLPAGAPAGTEAQPGTPAAGASGSARVAASDGFEEFAAPVTSQSGEIVVNESILRELLVEPSASSGRAPYDAQQGAGGAAAGSDAGAVVTRAPPPVPVAAPEPRLPTPAPVPAARLDFEPRPDTAVTGELLRRLREVRGIDLRDVAHHTKVSVTQLTAIEREAFHALPAAVYVRGFVQEYARYLRFPDPARAAKTYVDRYRVFLGDVHD